MKYKEYLQAEITKCQLTILHCQSENEKWKDTAFASEHYRINGAIIDRCNTVTLFCERALRQIEE